MKKAKILALLFLTILSVSGCTEIVYSVGQLQTLTDSLRENHLANEGNSMKDDF